jgi:hypothetical protein
LLGEKITTEFGLERNSIKTLSPFPLVSSSLSLCLRVKKTLSYEKRKEREVTYSFSSGGAIFFFHQTVSDVTLGLILSLSLSLL